jgi:peroxiredoxin
MNTSLPIFLSILILISSCTSQSDKNDKKFTLQGKINGQDTGKIILTYMPNETIIYDTAIIKNSKFVFTGKIFEPTEVTLNVRNNRNRVFVFLEPRKMKIALSKDKFEEFKMTGSKTQNDFELLNKMKEPFYVRISMLRNQYININDSIEKSKNDSAKILLKKKAEEIDKFWSQTRKKIDSIDIRFVMENPKSFLTVVQLHMLEANEVISLDSAKSIFNGLDNSLKETRYGKYIIEDIRRKENIRIGNQAPDFKAIDLNQQIVTLSQFKGESVILLDFWASWCVPCRQSIPHLKTIYKKCHSKGLEIIAVSLDINKKAWTDAVKHDSTDIWYHIPVAEKYATTDDPSQMTNDDIYKNYFVQAVPVTMLIDKNGKIIYRHVGYSKESEDSLDHQISQIFDK